MNSFRRCLVLIALAAASFQPVNTIAKEARVTLEDVIFDAQYLAGTLGPKTLLQVEGNTHTILKVLKAAGLDSKTKFMLIPDQATRAAVKDRINPRYPEKLRQGRDSGSSSFLINIGEDGDVKSIYCYKYDDRLLAIAAAMAVVKWKFEPLKIGDTTLPVVTAVRLDYNATDLGMPEAYIEGEDFANVVGPPPTAKSGPR